MASLYKRDKSAFWWIKYRDPKTGEIIRESTKFRTDVGSDTRKAQELEAQKTLEERKSPAKTIGKWDEWVVPYIQRAVSARTQERYLTGWRTLRMFLEERKIPTPQAVTYKNCSDYLDWRAKPDPKHGKYRADTNTGILEFKVFRWLMREAVRRDYCTGNPAREVVLKRKPRKLYSDYSDERLQKIYAAILTEPELDRPIFLRSFAVALFHGCRLNETNVNPMDDVDLAAEIPTIRFEQKGGRERIKPLHPQLIPLFQKLRKEKLTQTYPMEKDKNGRWRWGNRWTRFWQRHGFKEIDPNGCFHSIRVCVENTLREAGIEQRVREYYLSHEHGADVNALYDRIKLREMLVCHKPLERKWLKL